VGGRMRFRPAVFLAALALAAVPASAQAASPRCEAKEGDTIARNTTTRVFQRVSGTVDDGQDVRIYSCRLGTREGLQVVVTRNGGVGILDAGVVTVHDDLGARTVAPSGASDLGRGLGGNVVFWKVAATPFSTTLSGHPSDDAT